MFWGPIQYVFVISVRLYSPGGGGGGGGGAGFLSWLLRFFNNVEVFLMAFGRSQGRGKNMRSSTPMKKK